MWDCWFVKLLVCIGGYTAYGCGNFLFRIVQVNIIKFWFLNLYWFLNFFGVKGIGESYDFSDFEIL